MGPEQKRNGPEGNNMEELPVPPGFVSLTSFTLKRIGNSELEAETRRRDASAHVVDIGKLKKSLRHKPWILHSELDHFPVEPDSPFDVNVSPRAHLPKGVIRGCSSCDDCQKVVARWKPEEPHIPVLEEVPTFHPTAEEFADSIKYVSSIRSKAEMYGICRIVPPSSWLLPCLLMEKTTWSSSKFNTHVQRINELQHLSLASEYCRVHQKDKCKRRKVLQDSESESCEEPTTDTGEDEPDTESFKFESGPLFTLETFKKYAHDFKMQYFSKKDDVADSSGGAIVSAERGPTAADVEGQYWRVIENPTEEIEVLTAVGIDTRSVGSGFPGRSNLKEDLKYDRYTKSSWNLNNMPTLPGSLLVFENPETSATLFPRLSVGMCFSSVCWNVEEHHLYSMCYSHTGSVRIWYCIPRSGRAKFEEVVRKQYPQLSECPELLHKLAIQISPSSLIASGVPVYRCVQFPGQFVLVFPGACRSVFNCGFNCSEEANFATLDWLPHGQNIIELYREHRWKTSISHDKILLRAAMEFAKAQWELLLMKNKSSGDERWITACMKDGFLVQAFKSRIQQETRSREYLCSSSSSRKMEDDFDATTKRECCICRYDLHLSAVGCSCSPDKYTCLCHAKQLCSCPWTDRYFLHRYEIKELNTLAEALEGRPTAIFKWARDKLALTSSSSLSNDAGDRLRHGVKLFSTDPLKLRISTVTDLPIPSALPKDPASTPDAAMKGEDDRANRRTPTVGPSNGVAESEPHQTKQVPPEKLPQGGRDTARRPNPNMGNTCNRTAAEKNSRDQVIVIIDDDNDDD